VTHVSAAPRPANDPQRLEALRRYDLLDTPAEQAYDDLTQLASFICGTPISMVSLVDQHRQWFKSRVGITAQETARDVAFCAYAIMQDEVFVVCDAVADSRFAKNPLVTVDPHIRFYAGAPLVTADGYALGTLCVMDRVPRTLSESQHDALQALSRQAVAQMELRRHVHDLTEAYRRLQTLDQLKSEFVSTVSHELRTPLTSIRGGLQLVLDTPDGVANPDDRELLTRALANAERLMRLTSDVLDLSRIESCRLELRRASCSVAQLVRTACDNVAGLPNSTGRVRARVAPDVGCVDVDSDRIVQVLVNLLSNALKFSPASAMVRIDARKRGSQVEIAVRDQGPGITAEDLARLFQPFQRLASTRQIGGTGLGLAITKGLIEQHGGSIAVDTCPGAGATFTISLPRA
jgi:signal transduction histidine kinase